MTATAIIGDILLDRYDASDDSDITVYLIRSDDQAIAIIRSGRLNYLDLIARVPPTIIYTVEAINVMGQHSAPSNAASPIRL